MNRRSIALILVTVLFATTVFAVDFTTYRNSKYKYAIIYPSGWTARNEGDEVFSVVNNSKDVNLNVVAEELPPSAAMPKPLDITAIFGHVYTNSELHSLNP